MAKHLARIHGTEEDKVNCPFYFKIGACRHSDRCSRLHHKPAFSQTLLFKHLYQHPFRPSDPGADPDAAMEHFLTFFEDFYMECSKFGRIEGMYVADNLGDHLIGHVYMKFADEEEASDAQQVMHGRYYDGRPMEVEFSPVTDFREARCRDYDEDSCQRGGFCNFLHVKPLPTPLLVRSLEQDAAEDRRMAQQEEEERKRHHRHHRKRKRSSSRQGSSGGDDDDDDSDDREDDDDRRHRKSRTSSSSHRSSSSRHHRHRHRSSSRSPSPDSGRRRRSYSPSPPSSRGDKKGDE